MNMATESDGMIKVIELPRLGQCLREAGAANYLGYEGSSTLRNMRYRGIGPRSYKLGGRVFYRLEDLQAYVEANLEVVDTRDQPGRGGVAVG